MLGALVHEDVYSAYIQLPGANASMPPEIKDNAKYYPYFKNCLGAIDGTHIPAHIFGKDYAKYCSRKGVLCQNVLTACLMDGSFVYILSG